MASTNGQSVHLDEVLELCRKMTAEHEVEALLVLVAQEAAKLMRADRATIFLLDSERRRLWSKVALDEKPISMDAALGIAGEVALRGEVINVRDAQQDERFYSGVDAQTHYKTRSVLAVPIRTPAGRVIGAFETLNKKGGPFTETDEEIASKLAAQAAIAIENATAVKNLQNENAQLLREVSDRYSTQSIIGTSQRIQSIIRLIDTIRDSVVDVLITGESGTGKELVARALHYTSPRARQRFVALNCAALPEHLVESELFGHVKGAFTDARTDRAGLFETADGGTIFLDEIGEMSTNVQSRLLRVLQEREFRRVGGTQDIKMDVRVIAATNQDLKAAMAKGRFREDLYWRLRVVPIHTPALRDIREDIPLLANYLVESISRELGKDTKKISSAAMKCFVGYDWPGNVRELVNELKRLIVSVRKTTIGEDDLSENIRAGGSSGDSSGESSRRVTSVRMKEVVEEFARRLSGTKVKDAVAELERCLILDALQRTGGNQLQAAKMLGLSRQGLIKKVKRYRIKSP